MHYIKVTFAVSKQETSDLLTAWLAEVGYDGFEETDNGLLAYVEQPKFTEADLKKIAADAHVTYDTEVILPQNWNALWESNFPPVVVADFCTIRAHFHDISITTQHEIVITPKMSFGTGHHATTQLMMQMMRTTDFADRSVLDFGTGTGVLAILAEKLGASSILAIDNDPWCVENAGENILQNSCSNIAVRAGSLEVTASFDADIILANINRHILLEYMHLLYVRLKNNGTILMSGLLLEDEYVIKEAASSAGFVFSEMREQANWIALSFIKHNQ